MAFTASVLLASNDFVFATDVKCHYILNIFGAVNRNAESSLALFEFSDRRTQINGFVYSPFSTLITNKNLVFLVYCCMRSVLGIFHEVLSVFTAFHRI
ncbi:MAG: hypothetical protein ACI4OB_05575 [Christensenellales bacterium]